MAVHKEWSRQEVQGTEQVTGGASASTDGGGGQGSGKKKKKISRCLLGGNTTRRLNVNRKDFWDLQEFLDGKKVSLKNPCKC